LDAAQVYVVAGKLVEVTAPLAVFQTVRNAKIAKNCQHS
jgi:hypothetical protein